jgi:hypothetical protein
MLNFSVSRLDGDTASSVIGLLIGILLPDLTGKLFLGNHLTSLATPDCFIVNKLGIWRGSKTCKTLLASGFWGACRPLKAKSLVQTVIAWSDFILISFDYGKLVGERAEKGIDRETCRSALSTLTLKGVRRWTALPELW